jgi:hypothetical protein
VELRACNNIALAANIDFVTLHQWYNLHNKPGLREVYLKPPAGVKGAKGSAFCLELFIHEDMVSCTCCVYNIYIHYALTAVL